MKKILMVSICSLGVAVIGLGCLKSNAQTVKATAGSDLAELIAGYMDVNKQYTKKTQIFLNDTAVGEGDYFHAHDLTLERATYYDDDDGVLLMGNYDGTFRDVNSDNGINSGYRNISTGVQHFKYNAATAETSTVFTEREDGWTNDEQSVGVYYQTLTSLAATVSSSETKWLLDSDGWYKYDVSDVTYNAGEYSDVVLKNFQYFVAPMLLPAPSDYLSFKAIWVQDAGSFLSMRILLSPSDSGKVIEGMATDTEAILAEARIFKGVTFNVDNRFYFRGDPNTWVVDEDWALEYYASPYLLEQYVITVNFTAGQKFKISGVDWDHGDWGYNCLLDGEYTKWFRNLSNDISVYYSGTYTIYLNPIAGKLYAEVPVQAVPISFCDEWIEGVSYMYAWAYPEGGSGFWFSMSDDWHYAYIPTACTQINIVCMTDSASTGPDWGKKYKYRQTPDSARDIQEGKTLTITKTGNDDLLDDYTFSFTWE